MNGRFGYCETCKNNGVMCNKCYRGSYYDHDWELGERIGQYGPY